MSAVIAASSPARACSPSRSSGGVLVVIPTFNELENIPLMVGTVLTVSDSIELLIVDDHSPDGTGQIAEQLARTNPRVHVLHRRGPRGLGAAYMAGFRWALRHNYSRIVQMDADFSHDPAVISNLLEHSERCDLVIGSRYCPGGRTVGWPRGRQWLSFAANLYARMLLGSKIRDLTGGFKCWRRELLERIDFASLRADGYGFQVEMGHLAELAGARIREVPITFTERRDGISKMSPEVARRAAWHVLRLCWDRLCGRRHGALLPQATKEKALPTTGRAETHLRTALVMCLGGIGDTVLSFAMLRQLRERLPDSKLTALVMWPQAAELVEDLGIFDEIIQQNFQQDRGWRSLLKLARLHQRRFDLSILAYPSNRWEFKLASWIVHAKRRIGHRYENSGWFDNGCFLLTDVVDQAVPTHNVDENLRLLERVGGETRDEQGKVDIRLGTLASRYHEYADDYIADLPGPYLGIHAGCAEFKNMASRRWPAEHFAELCRLAKTSLGLTPLLFGAGAEVTLNEQIARTAGCGEVVQPASIRHTAALLQRCMVFVSNDSALAHVAGALTVPTIIIVGPTVAQMIRPFDESGFVVGPCIPCAPCYAPSRRPLRCNHETAFACLAGISPASVFATVESVIGPALCRGCASRRIQHDSALSETFL